MSTLIDFADRLRNQIDIVSVVEGYVALRNAGTNLKGLCPFHREKTPSFTVSPSKQIYHCFGCNDGGDVIKFVQKVERLEWIEAVRFLAQKYGIAMPELRHGAASSHEQDARERTLKVNEFASRCFQEQLAGALRDPSCEIAQYLKRRRLEPELIERFALGLAPNAWSQLLEAARKANYERELLVSAGLIIHHAQRDSYYDRFRKRLIFPICDSLGRAVAFGGRVYAKDASPDEPKYVNSPETVVYKKGQHLYALHLAKDAIVREKRALLMEGYMDVIRAHQFGFNYAVASCGTALTDEQARTLRKYCGDVLFVYDGDEAGQKAMLRGCEVLIEHGFGISVVVLPDGHDPDSYLLECGGEAFGEQLRASRDFFSFFLHSAAQRFDRQSVAGKVQIVEFLLPLLGKITNPVARVEYVRKAAEFLNLEPQLILRQLSDKNQNSVQRLRQQLEETDSEPCSRRDKLLLKLVIDSPTARQKLSGLIDTQWLGQPRLRHWYEYCQNLQSEEPLSWARLLGECEDEEDKRLLADLALDTEQLEESDQTLHHLAARLQFHYQRQQTELITQQIQEFYKRDPQGEGYNELLREIGERSPIRSLGEGFFLDRDGPK